jgi:hypothetical protein
MEKESIVVLELGFFAFNIKNKVCGVLDYYLYFLKNKKKIQLITCCLGCWIVGSKINI